MPRLSRGGKNSGFPPWVFVLCNGKGRGSFLGKGDPLFPAFHIPGPRYLAGLTLLLKCKRSAISAETAKHFRVEYPSMGVAQSDQNVITANLLRAGAPLDFSQQAYVILVDPVGNVMMYYTEDQEAEDIMSDLETLLKYSSLG